MADGVDYIVIPGFFQHLSEAPPVFLLIWSTASVGTLIVTTLSLGQIAEVLKVSMKLRDSKRKVFIDPLSDIYIKILFFFLLCSILSWLSLFVMRFSVLFQLLLHLYEAFCLNSFWYLIINYFGDPETAYMILHAVTSSPPDKCKELLHGYFQSQEWRELLALMGNINFTASPLSVRFETQRSMHDALPSCRTISLDFDKVLVNKRDHLFSYPTVQDATTETDKVHETKVNFSEDTLSSHSTAYLLKCKTSSAENTQRCITRGSSVSTNEFISSSGISSQNNECCNCSTDASHRHASKKRLSKLSHKHSLCTKSVALLGRHQFHWDPDVYLLFKSLYYENKYSFFYPKNSRNICSEPSQYSNSCIALHSDLSVFVPTPDLLKAFMEHIKFGPYEVLWPFSFCFCSLTSCREFRKFDLRLSFHCVFQYFIIAVLTVLCRVLRSDFLIWFQIISVISLSICMYGLLIVARATLNVYLRKEINLEWKFGTLKTIVFAIKFSEILFQHFVSAKGFDSPYTTAVMNIAWTNFVINMVCLLVVIVNLHSYPASDILHCFLNRLRLTSLIDFFSWSLQENIDF